MTSTSDPSPTSAEQVIAATYRAEWGRLLSLLVTRTRRLDLAEDALGEAFARASARWTDDDVPTNPAGWLYTTATRLILGALRAEAMHGRKVRELAVGADYRPADATDETPGLGDERLTMILLCCHPALGVAARSPLALRLVVGTPTAEIARLFLVSQPTMAARLTRAKKKIVSAGIPLAAPTGLELQDRLDDVCRTIYLAFTAGYTPGRGSELLRTDLAGEAVELAAVLRKLAPDAAQARALHALLVLQHARRDARVSQGRLVTLADQDRSLWHHDEIDVGLGLVVGLPQGTGYCNQLALQALIAAEHARARTAGDTDWSAIAGLYERLESLTGSPIVRLNRAVALAETDGPAAGLSLLSGLDEALGANHRLHAVRAEFERRAGNLAGARSSYERALELCDNEVERMYLADRLEGCY